MLLVVLQRGVGTGDGQAAIEQRVALGGGKAKGGQNVVWRLIGRGLDG
ncbi:hypothetical protein [Massilia sp. PAMC28688]|nr:hypothetical protein [Massilia sp. PAMC28688]